MSFENSSSTLEQLQERIRQELNGHELLTSASVISRLQGDILSQIEEQLGKLGLSIIVLAPVGEDIKGNYGCPYFNRVVVQIHCVEIPTTNSTGLTALDAAERVLRALHHKNFILSDGQKCLLVAENIAQQEDTVETNFVIVNFTTSAGLQQYKS